MLKNIITTEAVYFSEHNHTTNLLPELGHPTGTSQYFNFLLVGTGSNVIATATPDNTALAAGLISSWSMTYNGVSDKITTSFPATGF